MARLAGTACAAEVGKIKAAGETEAEVLKKKGESVDPLYRAAKDIIRNLASSSWCRISR